MRLFWLAILTAHATAAVAWWWLMPGGFGLPEARFWVNEALPVIVLALVLTVRFGVWRREEFRNNLLVMFPAFWLAAAVTARVVFPQSAAGFWWAPLLFGTAMAGSVAYSRHRPGGIAWAGAAMAVALGVAMPLAQRAAEPDTRPADSAALSAPDVVANSVRGGSVALSPDVRVDPTDPVVTLTRGRVTLAVQPVLTFVSRSPDRCWTLFASKADRDGPPRRLLKLDRQGPSVRLVHRNDLTSVTWFGFANDVLDIDSSTYLPSPIYSHLNTFTELTLSGHRKLDVEFSPCPGKRIEFKPFQIRGELPSRAAYLDRDGSFKVVQARRAEKGPFTTLAEGKLARRQSLSMTFRDQGHPLFEVTLEDWSTQAAVQPSPTAGYGLPVNAIEFSLDGDSDRSSAGVWITLAATSVGRGWDSVGHAAGTYRNRMRVRTVSE
jgi:hypothetical protein